MEINIAKRFSLFLVLTLIFTFSFQNHSFASTNNKLREYKKVEQIRKFQNHSLKQNEIHDRQLIIKLRDGYTLPKIEGVKINKSLEVMEDRNLYTVRIGEQYNFDEKLKELELRPEVDYVDPNYILTKSSTPNDPLLSQQWYLNSSFIPTSWGSLVRNAPVKVAVLDTGLETNHPDLTGRILPGYYSADGTTNVTDNQGHGTAVSGIIAANSNNGLGISGINPNVKVLPIKISDGAEISLGDAISGIYYAIEQKVNIINMSYGSPFPNETEFEALFEAYSNKITLVAASGNDGSSVNYPAAYPFVISVGSVNKDNNKSVFSSYGDELDISAPGEKITTTSIGGQYATVDGTSFAAPIISGISSLILSERSLLKPSEIEWLLENSTGTTWNEMKGFGKVNASKVLNTILPSLSQDVSNVPTAPKVMVFNNSYQEKVQLPDDVDWYAFQTNNDKEIEFELTTGPKNDLVMWVEKYDQNGNLLFSAYVDNGFRGENETYTLYPTPGLYKVAVFDYNYRWSNDPYTLSFKKQTVERVAGNSRIETAITISKKGWPSGLESQEKAVILARADNPADALSAASLSGVKDAPILLTDTKQVPSVLINELKRLQTKKVYVLGGISAISASVEQTLKNAGYDVQRINGADRFQTAVKINEVAGTSKKTEAFVVNGNTVADALSASSISAINEIPIYLSSVNTLPVTLPANIKKVTILGGTAAVNQSVESAIKAKGIQVTRISGVDRFETNIKTITSKLNPSSFILVRGTSTSKTKQDYPDAVAASGLAHRFNSAVVLSDSATAIPTVKGYVENKVLPFYVLGGEMAISTNVLKGLGLIK